MFLITLPDAHAIDVGGSKVGTFLHVLRPQVKWNRACFFRGRGCNPLMISHEIMRCSYSFSHNHGSENGCAWKVPAETSHFFFMIMAGTPWKINMETENLLFDNGYHLPSPHFLLISSGVTIPTPFAQIFSTPKKCVFLGGHRPMGCYCHCSTRGCTLHCQHVPLGKRRKHP